MNEIRIGSKWECVDKRSAEAKFGEVITIVKVRNNGTVVYKTDSSESTMSYRVLTGRFKMVDLINSPNHYTNSSIETIDYIKEVTRTYNSGIEAYCIGNVIKYISRAELKNSPIEDLKKAQWYLNKVIKEKECNNAASED